MPWPRFRYSLLTLLLAALLAGAVMLVWRVWQPWQLKIWTLQNCQSLEDPQIELSSNGKLLAIREKGGGPLNLLLDTRTGIETYYQYQKKPPHFSPGGRYWI